jgi:NADH dehydrogenase (ubiquinone) flavoprotein 1
VFKYHV